MDDIKVCPECNAEYYAHVRMCRSCDVDLVTPEERQRLKAVPKAEGALVCIEEGDYDKITHLASALEREGLETHVLKAQKGGCGGGDFGLFVAQSIARMAAGKIDEIWNKMHPELKEAEARLEAGLCPACGAKMPDRFGECPDCGLNLGGGCDDGGCNSGGCH
ncbi:MAG: hypothetical protein HY954_11095 [Deltaproteobacteria bacterium]|nr:hypothetical protein [Deltaproteobacteria bacterium]